MFNHVVVGVDEGGGGSDAIALAKKLIGQRRHLTLAHITTSDPSVYRGAIPAGVTAERVGSLEEREQERSLALLEKARGQAELGQAEIEITLRCVASASVGRGLHELAEAQGADLIVLGSSRRSLLGRVLIGDDTRAALNWAPSAVAIAPAAYSEHPVVMRHIGVGYDGSRESEHALKVGRELAAEHGAKLSAFTAISVPTAAFGPGALPLRDAIDALVNQARDRIAALGGVEPHAAFGATAEEVTMYSGSLDLLIVGSRGYGPVGRLFHGSTSQQLARTARCPLLVLTRAADAVEPRDKFKDQRHTPTAAGS